MQGFPGQGVPMSSTQTLPVPGVQSPLTPMRPAILPTGPLGGPAQAPGFPPLGPGLPGTYPSPFGQPAPSPFGPAPGLPPVAPSMTPTAGPATLGPAPTNNGTGGIPGVSMTPVGGVTAPAATGGPHPLPSLPQFPLPQGFPNPFNVQQLSVPQNAAPPGPTYTTGPQGFMPGIGYFGTPPGSPGQPGMPGGLTLPAPGPQSAPPPQAPMPPGGLPQANLGTAGMPPGLFPPSGFMGPGGPAPFPMPTAPQYGQPPQQQVPQGQQVVVPGNGTAAPVPGVMPPAPAVGVGPGAAPGPAAAAPTGQGHPFWVNLAWQLLQSTPVRELLGEKHGPLVLGNDRLRTLGVATTCLLGQELQQAFKAMTTGGLGQEKFLQGFAEALKVGLKAAGLLS